MVHQLLEKHRLDFPFVEGDESEQRERHYFLRGWLADVFADPKFRDEFLSELKRQNPYPPDIFTPPSDEDWKRVSGVLDAAGISSTQIFSKWGRDVFDNCIELSISRLLFD